MKTFVWLAGVGFCVFILVCVIIGAAQICRVAKEWIDQ